MTQRQTTFDMETSKNNIVSIFYKILSLQRLPLVVSFIASIAALLSIYFTYTRKEDSLLRDLKSAISLYEDSIKNDRMTCYLDTTITAVQQRCIDFEDSLLLYLKMADLFVDYPAYINEEENRIFLMKGEHYLSLSTDLTNMSTALNNCMWEFSKDTTFIIQLSEEKLFKYQYKQTKLAETLQNLYDGVFKDGQSEEQNAKVFLTRFYELYHSNEYYSEELSRLDYLFDIYCILKRNINNFKTLSRDGEL